MHPPPPLRAQTAPALGRPTAGAGAPPARSSAVGFGVALPAGLVRQGANAPSPTNRRDPHRVSAAYGAPQDPSPALSGSPRAFASPAPRARQQPKHHLLPSSPFGHPLSLADAEEASAPPPPVTDAVDLTDEELARLLDKARREEEEYARGLEEDPFTAPSQGGVPPVTIGVRSPSRREGGARKQAAKGDGRAIWDAALSGRGSQAPV